MSENFLQIQEEYLKKVWARTPEELEAVLPARCQGNCFLFRLDSPSGDFSFTLYPLSRIALYYVFYLPDEEFPAAVTCLFPANAIKFLPVAGLADVVEYTAKKIIELVRED